MSAAGGTEAMLGLGSRLAKRENVYCQDLTPLPPFFEAEILYCPVPPFFEAEILYCPEWEPDRAGSTKTKSPSNLSIG